MKVKSANALLRVALLVALLLGLTHSDLAWAAISYRGTAWFWANPLPQGDSIYSVEFAGSRGYAWSTTLLRTDDGGETWAELKSAPHGRPTVIDADTLITSAYRELHRSDDGGNTFRRLDPGLRSREEIRAVAFASPSTGYLATGAEDMNVLATDDGGQSFVRRGEIPRLGGRIVQPLALAFFDPQVGILLGWGPGQPGEPGVVLRTADGGRSWNLVKSVSAAVNDIALLGGGEALIVGGDGMVLRTSNRGFDWQPNRLEGAPPGSLGSVACRDRNTCLVTGSQRDAPDQGDGPLIRSTDGLRTGSVLPVGNFISSAGFAEAGRAIAVGEAGLILLSNNDGADFIPVTRTLPAHHSHHLQALSDHLLFGVSFDGGFARSYDGGTTWSGLRIPLARNRYATSYSFASRDVGFVLEGSYGRRRGPASHLLRTTDGGQSWRRVRSPQSRRGRAILAVTARRILIIGPRGRIGRSLHGGARIRPVRHPALEGADLHEFDSASRAVFAWGPRSIVRFTAGRGWRRVAPPGPRLRDVDFQTPRKGVAVSRGSLFMTDDAGRRWKPVRSIGGSAVWQASFADAKHGIADVSYPGYQGTGENVSFGSARVQVTSDGGRTWRLQSLNFEQGPVFDLLALDGPRAVVDLGGPLLWTDTGGEHPVRSTITVRVRRGLERPGVITVRGKLSPARPDQLQLTRWTGRNRHYREVTVGPGGGFRARVRVPRTSFIVVQVEASDAYGGAGSPAIKVTVERR